MDQRQEEVRAVKGAAPPRAAVEAERASEVFSADDGRPRRAPGPTGAGDGRRLERDLLDAVLKTSVAAIVMIDTSGQITFANDQAEEILGLRKDQLLERRYDAPEWRTTAIDGGPWPDDLQPFRRMMRTGAPVSDVRHAIVWPDGQRKLLSVNGAPIKGANGEILSLVCYVTDITERVRREQILQRIVESTAATGHAYLRSIVRAMSESLGARHAFITELVCAAPARARTVAAWMDGAMVDDIEYDLANTPCQEVLTQTSCFYRTGVKQRFPEDRMLQEINADSYLGVVLRSSSGRILGLMSVMSDVPLDESLQPEAILRIFAGKVAAEIERKHAEAALRISEAQYRGIFCAVADALFVLTAEGEPVEVNPAACAMLGYTREEILALPLKAYVHPESHSKLDELIRAAASEGRRYDGEGRAIRKDGSALSLEVTGVAFPYGGAPHILAILRDTSERRALEAQLFQAQKMESVGRLAGGVAHDFNNLLTAILCYGELCSQRSAPGSAAQEHLQQIIVAANRGARLTGQLLAFARKQRIEPRVLDLNELIAGAAEMLRRLIGEDVELACFPAEGLGQVRADPGQIEQILMNLAVNARDAMPGGGRLTIETQNVTLSDDYAERRAEITPGDYVMLAVTDSGEGIPPEQIPLIFEPFYTTKEAGRGTGLGLATCYGIVKQHRGHIAVYSEPGRGTIFKVYLPRVLEQAAPPEERPEAGATVIGDETILVVEDYGTLRFMAREVLGSLGYRVLIAADGEEALEVARAHGGPIHLLVTDVIMPRMGGRELAAVLRAERPELRVLYSSGYTENTVLYHGALGPGAAFIQKPYRLMGLTEKVRVVLDGAA